MSLWAAGWPSAAALIDLAQACCRWEKKQRHHMLMMHGFGRMIENCCFHSPSLAIGGGGETHLFSGEARRPHKLSPVFVVREFGCGVTSCHARRCCRNRGGLLRKQEACGKCDALQTTDNRP